MQLRNYFIDTLESAVDAAIINLDALIKTRDHHFHIDPQGAFKLQKIEKELIHIDRESKNVLSGIFHKKLNKGKVIHLVKTFRSIKDSLEHFLEKDVNGNRHRIKNPEVELIVESVTNEVDFVANLYELFGEFFEGIEALENTKSFTTLVPLKGYIHQSKKALGLITKLEHDIHTVRTRLAAKGESTIKIKTVEHRIENILYYAPHFMVDHLEDILSKLKKNGDSDQIIHFKEFLKSINEAA